VHLSVEAPCASNGVVDVGGQLEGSEETASDSSSGGWSMEKQSFGSSMGPLVRTALGAEKVKGTDNKGGAPMAEPHLCEGVPKVVSQAGPDAKGS
jgi:hypothetical protein